MTDCAKKGDWVEIHKIVIPPGKRASKLPDDTKKVALEMRVKGFACKNAKVGEKIQITTMTGRKVIGTLLSVNPKYKHDFGTPVPELINIGREVREILGGKK